MIFLFKKFIRNFLKHDGVLILHLIHHNGDPYELIQQEYQNPDSSDV